MSPSGCTHTPIAHVVNSYYGLPAPHGPSIDYRSLQDAPVAHDGRGDTIEQVGLGVEMTGPRGTITLTRTEPGNAVIPRGWGDFNGDGRTDLLVDVDDGKPEYATFIVPGTVGTGTHDPFVVGIRVPHPYIKPGAFEAFPAVVGDQNGDGADDISFGPKLYSGRQLMALPAGAALPAPFRTLPTAYVGLLQLDPHQPPTFVVPDPADSFVGGVDDRAEGTLDVLDRRADRLLFNAGPVGLLDALDSHALATGWLVNGHHVVEYDYETRSGETAWRWDLDAPCGT